MSELNKEEQMIVDLLCMPGGRRLTNSDLVELAAERGVDLTWSQVESIRDDVACQEEL